MQPLGPFALSTSNTDPIDVSWGAVAQPPVGIDLMNMSGLLLQVELSGQTTWIEPWSARFFPLSGNQTGLTILPNLDITPTSADPLKVLANLYQVGDTPPPDPVRQLTAMAAAAAVTGVVKVNLNQDVLLTNQIIEPTPSTPANISITIPDGILSLFVRIESESNPVQSYTLGVNTNNGPNGNQTFDVYAPEYFQADLVLDCVSGSTGSISVSVGSPATGTDLFRVYVWGYPLPASMVAGTRQLSVPVDQSSIYLPLPAIAITKGNIGASTELGLVLTSSMQEIVPAPPSGFVRIVEFLSFGGGLVNGDSIEFKFGNGGIGAFLVPVPSLPIFPNWILPYMGGIANGGLSLLNSTSSRGLAWATYHDEAIE